MNDELSQLLKDRFTGHETEVDPGLWDAIQGQMGSEQLAASEEGVKELFQQRFNGHEVHVDPAAWANISQQLGSGAAVGGAGTGAFVWISAAIGAVVIAGATFLYMDRNEVAQEAIPARIEVVAPAPSSPAPSSAGDTAARILPLPTTERIEELPATHSDIPASKAELTAPTTPPDAALAPDAQVVTPEELPGARIVENIIAELTTRVTEDVLAEAAERRTMAGSSTVQKPELDLEEPETTPEAALPQLFLANTFTPNGDGVNDTYTVLDASGFDRVMLRVYDVRNDRLVFSTNTNEPWTGNGCMDGYYLVAVEAMTTQGQLVTQGKVVWLNRNTMH